MASVNSPIRSFLKPVLFRLLGKKGYLYMQYLAKVKDIKKRLVEEKEMAILPELVNEGDEVIDIGANYAYYSERLSRLVGPVGKVYAFEPIPFTFMVCQKVLNYFKAKNVELYKKGVGEKNEVVEFSVPIADFGGISAGQAHFSNRNNEIEGKERIYKFNKHEKIACEVVSLDDFLGERLKKLSFIKIDIEGAELFALKGMTKVIYKFKPVILIEIEPFFLKGFNINVDQLFDLIKNQFEYDIYYLDERKRKLKLLDKDPWDGNYILIHSSKKEKYKNLIDI
jgi:FkbM family methyltransferase